ncbi:MAG TPA: hypothetical protein VKM55_29860 [Candidatus Lokiarchaeia archaeon]|nr:hypothetical protein [Candidatus Lokiarchaeia archaeon]
MPGKNDRLKKWKRRFRVLLSIDAIVLLLGIIGLSIGLGTYRNSPDTVDPIIGILSLIGVFLIATAPALLWGTIDSSINLDAWKREEF